MEKSTKYWLRIEHLWGLAALVGIFIFVSTHPIRPHDFWWHITIGREILTTSSIPTIDLYSYTASGQPYPSYSMFWLIEIFLFGLYNLGGPELVILIHSLLITAAYVVIFWICKQTSNSWRIAAFSVLFAAALGLNDWNVRPQGITFLLASLNILAVFEYKKTNRLGWLVIIPVGMLVWSNSHGSFLIGIALIGIWWCQEVWNLIKALLSHEADFPRKTSIISSITLGITILTCLINPRGLGIITYVRTLTGNSVIQNLVVEWAPPTINSLMGALFYIGLMISAIVLILSPKRPSLSQVLTFIVFGVLGLQTSRGSVWFGLVMAPIIAEHIPYILQKYRKKNSLPQNPDGSRILNIIFFVVIMIMGVFSLPWFKHLLPLPAAKADLISAETPISATQILLEKNPPGELFNAISFGSYLIWSAFPQYQVFVDSRIELFPEKVWMDYLKISNAQEDWDELLAEYGVNTLMLSPAEQPALINAVKASGEWKELYQDDSAYIFIRQ